MITQTRAEILNDIVRSMGFFIPELIVTCSIVVILVVGILTRKSSHLTLPLFIGIIALIISLVFISMNLTNYEDPVFIFNKVLRTDDFSLYFRLLIDLAGLLTLALAITDGQLKAKKHTTEFAVLLFSIVLGAHLLVMTTNFIMLFIALEMISIPSYVLTGYGASRKAAEGSLKYFLFGATASAVMLYGFTILFGLTGSIDYGSAQFVRLIQDGNPLFLVSGLLVLAGFLYKTAAAPLHLWAPDVYEASPTPVVALFSVAPKLAGVAALSKFTLALTLFGQSVYDWQTILAVVAILSITIGNFSALWQKDVKRMMAYSSIAQTGFLLVGVCTFSLTGYQFMLFYAAVYLIGNFIVFATLQSYEKLGVQTMEDFKGFGLRNPMTMVVLLIALISLAGIPPTAGFVSKLFVFSALWEAYSTSDKGIIIVLLIFGLANTVVSIFYYLKIPYFAFFKPNPALIHKLKFGVENFLSLILVIVLLVLFLKPDFLMGWLNRINFVL